ncbi:MAG: zinc-binding dehydrogenase [Candidatus Acidiferrum sp.]
MRTTTTKKTDDLAELEAAAPARSAATATLSLPSKMTAAVLYGSEDLRIEKIDMPVLGADEVLLRVRLALTDGTDLKVWKRGYHAKMIQPPAVFGHEVVGEIAAVGKRVDARWRLGMRVIAANSAPCLRCYHCRRGQENLCEDLLFNNGAYAEYMRIPGRIATENMLEVPHSVDDASAALSEPLACVLRGIHEMEVRNGDTSVVIGCGPIGLKYVRMLSRRGVRVIALARRAAPLEVAKRLGAFATINVRETPDIVTSVKTLTEEGRGADSVVEAAGNPVTWQQSLAMVRRGGVVNFFSGLPSGTRVEIDPAAIHYAEIKLISPFHHTPRFIREALEAIRRGDISAHEFVTDEIGLADLPRAFERMKARSGEIKLAVRP